MAKSMKVLPKHDVSDMPPGLSKHPRCRTPLRHTGEAKKPAHAPARFTIAGGVPDAREIESSRHGKHVRAGARKTSKA